MTVERKALTSIFWTLCLLALQPIAAAPGDGKGESKGDSAKAGETAKPATGTPKENAEKATGNRTPPASEPKGKEPGMKEPAGDDKPGEEEAKEEEKAEDGEKAAEEDENEAEAEKKEAEGGTAVARPLTSDPVQVYGWREWVVIGEMSQKMPAKLDTGALTSSIHAEEKELFERDGKKWVRFIVTDPGEKKAPRTRIEAPLVRIAHIKEPGGEPQAREVVRLNFTIGDRKLRAEFTLNNRSNMLSPVLIGRNTIKELGWIDPSRAYLADQKIMR